MPENKHPLHANVWVDEIRRSICTFCTISLAVSAVPVLLSFLFELVEANTLLSLIESEKRRKKTGSSRKMPIIIA